MLGELSRAEDNLKKSLELDVSQEEQDYFDGKLTKEDLTRLVVRLRMLQRNIELKGKALERDMCEPSLLSVLKRRIQKFLLKLQAYGRARRPKEKKKGTTHKNSSRKLPFSKVAELLKEDYEEKKLNCVLNKSGRNMLINGHNKKFFKENFKPP